MIQTPQITQDNEQEPTVKQPQKVPKISDPQEAPPASFKPAKTPNCAAADCAYIVRKGTQCRFRVSDEADKFCRHHKKT